MGLWMLEAVKNEDFLCTYDLISQERLKLFASMYA